jgi:DNA processing protein
VEAGLPEADAKQGAILSVLQLETPSHVDEIVDRLENKLTAPEILALLFDLELAGKVRQLPGKNYVRVC